MVDLSPSFSKMREQFKFSELNKHQKEAIISAVLKKKDVFVSLPTGFGKSVIFQALLMVFDGFTGESGHIVIVVSPLLSLIKVGISCVTLSEASTRGEIDLVKGGFYSVVYATPDWRRTITCILLVLINKGKGMCLSREQPLVGRSVA